jgi:mRNA interferase MazF
VIWRGEVYYVDLGQPVGHEPAFRRPAVVVSVDVLNNGAGGLVVVVPVTTNGYGLRSHVELEPEASGLDHTAYARCDQLRVVSIKRLAARQRTIGPGEMRAIDQALRFVLDL